MNIDYLHLFIRLATTHNISQAGEDLGLSPAVASSHLRKLETDLGVRLFHRTTRQVTLSEEGRLFLPHAEEILASIESARAAMGSRQQTPRGTLRVTVSASFGRMHLLPGVPGLMERYPEMDLDLRLSDTIVDVVEGGFDIAIRNSELKDSSMIARRLAPDRRLVCASPAYLEKHGVPQTPSDLSHHRCLNLLGLDQWGFITPAGIETVRVNTRLRVDNGEAVRDACVAGLGITTISTWSAYQHLASGELVEILADTPLQSSTDLWAIYPSTRQLAPKVRAFLDYYLEYFGTPPYWDTALARGN